MTAETDWSAVADSVYREFVEDERREKAQQHLEELQEEIARLRAEVEGLRSFVTDYISAFRNGFDGDDHLLNLAKSLLIRESGNSYVE